MLIVTMKKRHFKIWRECQKAVLLKKQNHKSAVSRAFIPLGIQTKYEKGYSAALLFLHFAQKQEC